MTSDSKLTEGREWLGKLQDGSFKPRDINERIAELTNYKLTDYRMTLLKNIHKYNKAGIPPLVRDLKDKSEMSNFYEMVVDMMEDEFLFTFTIAEAVLYYGPEYLGVRYRNFHPPDHLSWMSDYSEEYAKRHESNPRSKRCPRRAVTLVKIDGKAGYQYLGLNKPIPEEFISGSSQN